MTANLRRRKRRIRPDVLHALMSAATRQLLNEPADSPSRKPSLAQLHSWSARRLTTSSAPQPPQIGERHDGRRSRPRP